AEPVVCLDAVLQVLILNDLLAQNCTRIVQSWASSNSEIGSISVDWVRSCEVVAQRRKSAQAGMPVPLESENASRMLALLGTMQSVT
ncbi:MAG: hypothetical protein WB543_18850, partial [Candidatus Acidiferrum sp.]